MSDTTGETPTQLTREELDKLPHADRLQAARDGKCADLIAGTGRKPYR